jgi:hypothetical protein
MNLELNEKLLKYAGFYYSPRGINPYYYDPNGQLINKFNPAPDLPIDLNGIFEWLVPMHPKDNPDIRLIQHVGFDYGRCTLTDIMGNEYLGENENPATAFCLAFDRLIDAEGK